jgi:hypothetical protein
LSAKALAKAEARQQPCNTILTILFIHVSYDRDPRS